MPGPVRQVVVAGGGLVGWSAAAALKRRLPLLSVTLVAIPPRADALADRIGTALPSITGFHEDVGLTEADTVARAGSSYRLGTSFEGWSDGLPSYVHAYGEYGGPLGAAAFHQCWLRAAREGRAAPFDSFSAAAALARAGRFAQPRDEPGSPLAGLAYGLQLNPARYLQLLRAFGRHLGVEEVPGRIADVGLRASDGFVEALRLDDGRELAADLFIDCTGPEAAIRSALDTRWEDWSRWLPCDRILLADAPPAADPPLVDRAIAHGAGWRWESPSPSRTSHGFLYSSNELSDSKAERMLRVAANVGPSEPAIRISAGHRPEPWLRNCVVLGDAAVAVEPLEWTNLHMAQSAIDRIVAMMPGRDCTPLELTEYNRQCTAEADRVRDFLALHYLRSRRDEPFWRAAASVEPPASLAHTLRLFEERGRLPFFEEETFSRDSWLAVLIGKGVLPRRIDPLADLVAPDVAEASMRRMASSLGTLAAGLPTHGDYLRNLPGRASHAR